MRVAIINQPWSVCPPDNSSDSIAIITYELGRRLAAMKDRVSHVRCYGRVLEDRPASEVLDGVEYRRVRAPLDRLAKPLRLLDKWSLSSPGKPVSQSVLYHLQYATKVARDLRRDPCDVVHVHNFLQCARIIRRFNPNAKIVLHMHCDWLSQLDEALVHQRLNDVDLVLGVSNYITDRVRKRFPHRAGSCHTLYNGADLARFGIQRDHEAGTGQRILFVGRISPEKGVHTLLQAFVQVADRLPTATLDLAGPESVLSREFLDPRRENPIFDKMDHFFRDRGSYLPYVKGLVPPTLSSRIHFLGGIPQSDLPKRYSAADLFVLPSVFDEPFGMPLAEAMAAGTPCIATLAGAFPEIVDPHRTGLLVKRDDANELANAFQAVLENPAIAAKMGAEGRADACQKFAWDGLADTLLRHYELVTASAGKPLP